MKIKLKIKREHLPIYILIVSVFFNNFIIQYAALAVVLLIFFLDKPKFKNDIFFNLSLLLIFAAFISYFYNLYKGNADAYSIIFWLFSYFPPFVLIWYIIQYRERVNFIDIYTFYKRIVYFQSFLLILSAIKHHTYIVGDIATGTVGDANWVAFHICVVLIFEMVRFIVLSKNNAITGRHSINSIVEIIYFLIVFLIPESTANLGFLMIIIGVLFLKEYFLSYANIQRTLVFLVIAGMGFYLVSGTFVYNRIQGAIDDLTSKNIDENPYLFKASMYKKIATGNIYKDVNVFVGSGPSTFTSRSSVIRMPEERVNSFPIELPYFKNKIFATYISPMYANWRASGESYGNFASPQTTVISIAVELGLMGLLIFGFYFYFITKAINRTPFKPKQMYLKKFGNYLTLFFVLSLFHLNFWEYPIVCFTYIIFIFLIIRPNPVLSKAKIE